MMFLNTTDGVLFGFRADGPESDIVSRGSSHFVVPKKHMRITNYA